MHFLATLQLHGKTATGLDVPSEVVAGLRSGKRPAVRVTLNDYTYRTTIAPMGGRFLIPVSADVRVQAGIAAGDQLEVGVELDTAPRAVEVPPDLAAALEARSAAREAFGRLSFTNQKEIVLALESARTETTRTRRLSSALARLDGF